MFTRVPVCSIAVSLAILVAVSGRTTAADTMVAGSQQFLESLRAHDARFDNCSVQWTQRETKPVDERAEFYSAQFNTARFGGTPQPAPAEFPDPYDATLMHNGQLTIRGADFMLSTVWLTDQHGHPRPSAAPILWGRATGIERSLDTDEAHRVMYINQPPADECTLLQWKRMSHAMSLGVGYSRWLQEINSLEKTKDGWSVTGSMNLFGVDRTSCTLEVDADLIVRKARVYCIVGPETGPTRERLFEICNSGALEDSEGPLLAASGSFRETTVIAVVDGESRTVNQPGDNWTLEAGPVEFNLSDERYSELTWLDEKSAEEVIDRRQQR